MIALEMVTISLKLPEPNIPIRGIRFFAATTLRSVKKRWNALPVRKLQKTIPGTKRRTLVNGEGIVAVEYEDFSKRGVRLKQQTA